MLELAHDVPMAGHVGQKRSIRRIRRRFWWPDLEKDAKQYVRSCPQCQKMSQKKQRVLENYEEHRKSKSAGMTREHE